MSLEPVAASSAITLALVFYAVGVFFGAPCGISEEESRNTVLVWLDYRITGTTIMTNIAQTSGATGFGVHAISGLAAIILMLIHAVWATATFLRRNERAEKTFHTFSTLVWLLWLVPLYHRIACGHSGYSSSRRMCGRHERHRGVRVRDGPLPSCETRKSH